MRPLSAQQRAELEEATSLFQRELPNSEEGIAYLRSRGLSGHTAQRFRLGYVPTDAISGSAVPEPWHQFAGMVSIPNINAAGRVVGLKFRNLVEDAKPKYTGRSGEAKRLFNTAAFGYAGDVIAITEGEFDAMVSTQCGIPAVSVASGAQSWKPHHTRMFTGFTRVNIIADSDKPGKELAVKLVDALPNAVVIQLPEGQKDINDVLINLGQDFVRDLLSTSRNEED